MKIENEISACKIIGHCSIAKAIKCILQLQKIKIKITY